MGLDCGKHAGSVK